MNGINPWANPSHAGLEDPSQMAAFLEERSRQPDQAEVNLAVCEALAPAAGEHLLEVGCGTGVLCRLVAPRVAPGGWVLGLDISPHFTIFARGVAMAAGLPWIHHHTGRGERLPYCEDGFDGAWAARLLLHAVDPQAIVDEMARVVRPGGRVVLADWDFGTVALDHSKRELTRKVLNWRTDHKGGDNWSGRKLLRRAHRAGLHDLELIPVVIIARDDRSSLTQSLWRAAEAAREGGAITPRERAEWVAELEERIEAQEFFASILYMILKGTK